MTPQRRLPGEKVSARQRRRMWGKKACFARHFDLLRNSPLSSIYIHFGVELLVLPAFVTSADLSETSFHLFYTIRFSIKENPQKSNKKIMNLQKPARKTGRVAGYAILKFADLGFRQGTTKPSPDGINSLL